MTIYLASAEYLTPRRARRTMFLAIRSDDPNAVNDIALDFARARNVDLLDTEFFIKPDTSSNPSTFTFIADVDWLGDPRNPRKPFLNK